MKYQTKTDQSDYIESAAVIVGNGDSLTRAYESAASCRSCGGGCYGCKGSSIAEVSSGKKNAGLKDIVEQILK